MSQPLFPSLAKYLPFAWLAATLLATPTAAQTAPATFRYADVAELVVSAPIILQGRVEKATRLKGEQAVGAPAGHARFLVTSAVTRLIAGRQGVPGTIRYLVDVPLDERGRAPKLRKSDFLLFLKPVAGRDDQFTLVSRNAQLPWTPQLDATTVAIAKESQGPLGSLAVTGIGNAFHVPGSLPGESETQIFLTTADQRPVSLSVLRRPGETPRWFASLGEIVADTDAPASRETLLWYKLACFLPAAVPAEIRERLGEERDEVDADYGFIRQSLGPCP